MLCVDVVAECDRYVGERWERVVLWSLGISHPRQLFACVLPGLVYTCSVPMQLALAWSPFVFLLLLFLRLDHVRAAAHCPCV